MPLRATKSRTGGSGRTRAASGTLTLIVEKKLGGKAQKMIYGAPGDDTPTRNVPTAMSPRRRRRAARNWPAARSVEQAGDFH